MKKSKLAIFTSGVLLVSLCTTFLSLWIVEKNKMSKENENVKLAYSTYCKAHPYYKGSIDEWTEDVKQGNYKRMESYETFYNIIYANATVPPVMAALECLNNNNKTYALIERGKTYAGIEQTSFINLGFDTTTMHDRRFTQKEFTNVVDKINELNAYGHEHFNIYLVDYRALDGVAIASNSLLNNDQYMIYMIEDGTGTYTNFYNKYLKNKTVSETTDEPYSYFKTKLNETDNDFNLVINNKNNVITDTIFKDNWARSWALSTKNNFKYILQSKEALEQIFNKTKEKSKLASVFGFGERVVDEKVTLNFKSISEGVSSLSGRKKDEYLKLMYGDYYLNTYNTLKRTKLNDGTEVPTKKMVFIPGRIMDFHKVATDENLGIGSLSSDVPQSYEELDEKYKMKFLFNNKSDYNSFLSALNNEKYIKGSPTEDQLKAAKKEIFNYLINYMFILKLSYDNYGYKYDIIMKGHPSEEIDHPESWTKHYVTSGTDKEKGYKYDNLLSAVFLDFHNNNSIGKYIGMVPYGTAAENLAYLGVDIGLGGLPSSTYTGYDTSVPVEFVINLNTNDAIDKDSALEGRYSANTLFYYDDKGEKKITKYINKGKYFDVIKDEFETGTEWNIKFNTLLQNWLKQKTKLEDVSNYTVDDQGFVVKKQIFPKTNL